MQRSTSTEFVLYFIIMILALFIFTVTIIDLGGGNNRSLFQTDKLGASTHSVPASEVPAE